MIPGEGGIMHLPDRPGIDFAFRARMLAAAAPAS